MGCWKIMPKGLRNIIKLHTHRTLLILSTKVLLSCAGSFSLWQLFFFLLSWAGSFSLWQLFFCGSFLSNGKLTHLKICLKYSFAYSSFSSFSENLKKSSAFLDVSHFFFLKDIYQNKGKLKRLLF